MPAAPWIDESAALLASLAVALSVGSALMALTPAWDALARRQVADLAAGLRAVRIDTTGLTARMRWWGGAMFAATVVLLILRLPILIPPALFLIFVAPRYWLGAIVRRRRTLLRDQMAVAGVALANTSRAGLSIAQGLESILAETPEPLSTELRQVVHEFQRGRPLPDALTAAKERLDLDGFTLFVSALLTCLERGGRVTEALDGISRSLQEAQRLERKIEADTASGRKVVVLLSGFPVLFLAGFALIDPEGTGLLFTTIIGQVVLVVVAALIFISAKLSERILRLEV